MFQKNISYRNKQKCKVTLQRGQYQRLSNGHTANDPLGEGGSLSILRAGTCSSKPCPQSSSNLTDQQVLKCEGTRATAMPANAVTSTNGAINTKTVNPR